MIVCADFSLTKLQCSQIFPSLDSFKCTSLLWTLIAAVVCSCLKGDNDCCRRALSNHRHQRAFRLKEHKRILIWDKFLGAQLCWIGESLAIGTCKAAAALCFFWRRTKTENMVLEKALWLNGLLGLAWGACCSVAAAALALHTAIPNPNWGCEG